MRDDLVAVEIEIDPFVGRPPLRAAHHSAIEAARRIEVVDREGKVERGAGAWVSSIAGANAFPPSNPFSLDSPSLNTYLRRAAAERAFEMRRRR
jgi:hypothetical protein